MELKKYTVMKYGKLKNVLANNDSNSGMVAFALVSGLAIGGALAILFAPSKGKDLRGELSGTRHKLSGTLNELMESIKQKFGNKTPEAGMDQAENNQHHAQKVKKPKSDIKELIHEAHQVQHQAEAPSENV